MPLSWRPGGGGRPVPDNGLPARHMRRLLRDRGQSRCGADGHGVRSVRAVLPDKAGKALRKGHKHDASKRGRQTAQRAGRGFLSRYFEGTSKMQKDRLSRAIFSEAEACGAPCLYDLRDVPEEEIRAHCLFYRSLCRRAWTRKQRCCRSCRRHIPSSAASRSTADCART